MTGPQIKEPEDDEEWHNSEILKECLVSPPFE